MDALIQTIDKAVQSSDFETLAQVFSFGPSSWETLGQGEQRSLAAHFIKAAVTSPSFNLQEAFASSEMMKVLSETLSHLPSVVEGGADNKLRQAMFDHLVNDQSDFVAAARVLSGLRMSDDESSPYFLTPAEKCDGELVCAHVGFLVVCVS